MNVQKHSIVNSFLLIDTIKSTCKNEKKSTINDSLFAFALQKFDTSIVTSKQIFESILIFEIVVSQKSTFFQFIHQKLYQNRKRINQLNVFLFRRSHHFERSSQNFKKFLFKSFQKSVRFF